MGNTSQLDYEAVQQAYQDVHDKEGTVHSLPFATGGMTAAGMTAGPPLMESEEFTESADQPAGI